jgi:hypothetical protein
MSQENENSQNPNSKLLKVCTSYDALADAIVIDVAEGRVT